MTKQKSIVPLAVVVMLLLAGLSVLSPAALAAEDASTDVAVETGEPSDVTESAAWLDGELTHLNESVEEANVSITYWEAGDAPNATEIDAGELDEPDDFEVHVVDLEPNTTYQFQAVAEANGTLVNGTTVEFTTAAREIELNVETEAATNVTNATATLNANVTELDANATNATVWFQYWVEDDRSTKAETEPVAVEDNGTYATDIANLSADTTYVFRAHAETNATDVDYTADDRGAELTFETGSGEFAVETTAATDVTNASATLNGDLEGLNGSASANVSFSYWVEGDVANATAVEAGSLDSVGAFSAEIDGLENNTTYAYAAQAEADNQTVTGENVTFATGAASDEPSYDGSDPFGLWLNGIMDDLRDSQNEDTPFGQLVSEIVRANNPGQGPAEDKERGPPEDKERGPPEDDDAEDDDVDTEDDAEAEDAEDKERGPPEDAGPKDDKQQGPPEDTERGPSEDKERGPPEDAGPKDDDAETEDENERGPPENAGPKDDKQQGPPEDRGKDTNDTDDEDDTEEETPEDDSDAEETDEGDDGETSETDAEEGEDDTDEDEEETDEDDGKQRGPPEDKPGKGPK